MINVYYDDKCGLCAKEINYYKKIAPKDVFYWQDVTESKDELKKLGIKFSDALRLLHAKDGHGEIYIGPDAFILIWKQLKWWRILAAIFSAPIAKPIVNIAYRTFADWRFKRLKHCQLAVKDENK